MNNAYLIVTDLHDHYCNIPNRVDYVKEIDYVRNKIMELGKQYLALYDNVSLILMGDVFRGSYNDPDSAVIINNFWYILNDYFENIYCVLGNHETSYYTSNPFFTLVQNIESEKVKRILNKNWTPKGIKQVFRVVDTVQDGNVIFHFNHFDTTISRAVPGLTNIALYHQDIVNKQVLDLMQMNYHNEIYQNTILDFDNVDIFDGFAYNFFGHMHKVYGTFKCTTKKHEETVLCYLASLGRPNVTEVNDLFLERNIPAVIVKDGEFQKVEDNKFNLMSREECVKEDVVQIQKEAYSEVKHRKVLRNYKPGDDNPIQNIRNCIMLTQKEHDIFDELLDHDTDRYSDYLLNKCETILGVSEYG